ncbi:MAG TPA: serine/threonine-protein kinase [Gemmatales bacterium]|nr:serine/threonine-protein kinase [Gemmatales bacterium]
MSTLCHPEPDQLRSWLAGRLPAEQAEQIEAHVADCAPCSLALAALDDSGDRLLTCMRQAQSIRHDTWRLESAVTPDAQDSRPSSASGDGLPSRLHHYEIERELGRGGMGRVFLAHDARLRRSVALKVLSAGTGATAEDRGRFKAEALAAARLQHPNIVQIYEVGEWQGLPFLALEYIGGGTLRDRCWPHPLPPAQVAPIVAQLAHALHHAHLQGVIHRDLKPANVLLAEVPAHGPNGSHAGLALVPKLSDFGLAKLRLSDDSPPTGVMNTEAGTLLGTPAYMAPELAAQQPASVASDVYGLGTVLYEALTGRPPFTGSDPIHVLAQAVSEDPVPPRRLSPNVPRELDTICLCCLAKEPARRYPSALALAEDLERWSRGEPIHARPLGPLGRVAKWARRRPLVATMLAGIVLATAVVIGVFAYQQDHLQKSLVAAQKAEQAASASAELRAQQLEVALRTMDRFIFSFQQQMEDVPSARPVQQAVLDAALVGLKELADVTGQAAPDIRRLQAHRQLGNLMELVGQSAESRAQFQAVREQGDLLLARGGPQLDRAAVISSIVAAELELARQALTADRPREAEGRLQAALALLADYPPGHAQQVRYLRLEVLDRLAWVAHWTYNLARMRQLLAEALPEVQALAQEQSTEQVRMLQARLYTRQADLQRAVGNFDDVERLMAQVRSLERSPRNLAQRRSLLVTKANAASDRFSLGQVRAAVAELRLAAEEARELCRSDPQRLQHQLDLAQQLYNLGYAERIAGRLWSCRACMLEADALLAPHAEAGRLADQAGIRQMHGFLRKELMLADYLPWVILCPEAAWLADEPLRWWLLAERARWLSWQERTAEAERTWELLLRADPKPEQHFEMARVLSASCLHLWHRRLACEEEPQESRWVQLEADLIDRAVGRLTEAVRHNPAVLQTLEAQTWQPIRDHEGFRKLQAMAAGQKEGP